MYISYWIPVVLAVATIVILLLAYFTKPKHLAVRFTKIPPVVARVNTPSTNANEKQRTVNLPTGDNYIIPSNLRGHFVLVFDWQLSLEIDGTPQNLIIPKLSTTDFASIPIFLHSLISPLNNTVYAAIVHDYLYRNPQDKYSHDLPRETIDRIFYWGMRVRGVTRITAGVMYIGVRIGGKESYQRLKAATQNGGA
jgi:hypothetical protein